MSIREGNLLQEVLGKSGYEVDYSYSFSCLPSITESFTRKMFNASSPSSLTTDDFTYHRVGHGDIGFNFIENEDFLVWISFPDEILHKAGRILPPEEAYKKTKDLLLEILDRTDANHITIMADHGYIIKKYNWSVDKEDRNFLKSVFDSKHYSKLTNLPEDKKEEIEKLPKDLSYFFRGKDYLFLRGRYHWSFRSRSVITHGGLSLMECLIPLLEVKR